MDNTRDLLKRALFPSLLVVLLAALPFYMPPYTPLAVTSILMYVVLTVSWAMLCGPTRYMSLATATFFGVGMYTSAVLGERLPFPVVVVCGSLVSFLHWAVDRLHLFEAERLLLRHFHLRA